MDLAIKRIRESKGISTHKLAEMAGISRVTLWKLETKKDCVVTTKTLNSIANALGVDVAELFL